MSKFNNFAKQVDEIARSAFKEYRNAETALTWATRTKDATPRRSGAGLVTDAEYETKAARAEAVYLEAKQDLQRAREAMSGKLSEFSSLRKELVAALEEAFSADPAQIDTNAVELLKSGVLRPNEYVRLYDAAAKSDNPTMCRVVARYAASAADALGNDPDAGTLRVLANRGATLDGSEYLQAFDYMTDVYSRCVNNPGMVSHWDELTADVLTEF